MGDLYVKGKKVSGTVSSASTVTCKDIAGNKHTLQKVLDNRPVNNNLLINSNFANPVNQREFTELTISEYGYKYTIDRWVISQYDGSASSTLKIGDGCVILSGDKKDDGWVTFGQFVEYLPKGTYTLSTKINGKIYSHTFDYNQEDGFGTGVDFENDAISIGADAHAHWKDGIIHPFIWICIQSKNLASASIEWTKLELCDHATPYVPRLYEEELELCQRYYQIIHNNLFPWSATTSDMVFHQHFKPMRITPTISIIEAAVYLENQKQSSFKFRTDYKTNRRFNLYATKSSHGLKGKAYVGLFLNVALDAEL